MKPIIALCALLFASAVSAQGYSYDYRSGNSYYTTPSYGGGASVYGNNINNGSSWSTQIDRNGDMRGIDSKGGYWSYDSDTGYYNNSRTGKTCYGTGYARTCY